MTIRRRHYEGVVHQSKFKMTFCVYYKEVEVTEKTRKTIYERVVLRLDSLGHFVVVFGHCC